MKRFNNLYGRPVIPFYRTTLYELVLVGGVCVCSCAREERRSGREGMQRTRRRGGLLARLVILLPRAVLLLLPAPPFFLHHAHTYLLAHIHT